MHPARSDHRLAEERRDALGPDALDRLPQRTRVVPRHLLDERDERLVAGAVCRDAAERRAVHVHAVVGEPP